MKKERFEIARVILWVLGAILALLSIIFSWLGINKEHAENIWLIIVIYLLAVIGWLDYTVVLVGPYWPGGLMPYWLSLATLYIAVTFLIIWHSYIFTESVKTAIRHGSVIFLCLVGALADWFFFLWAGYVDNLSMQWTWMWQHMVFGWWNGYAQVVWSVSIVILIILIWKYVRDKNTYWVYVRTLKEKVVK